MIASGPIVRIIPRLDIKGANLVKGIHLEGLRVLGKPDHFAEYYYHEGADELLFMDAVASLYGRNAFLDIIQQTSRKQFIPLTVGGGIRTIDDIRMILRAGADKVALNTAAIRRPKFIEEASHRFGLSTIVISIEAMKRSDGTYEAFTDNGREKTGINAIEWAKKVTELGAGEILITSIDREGTGQGYDLELTRSLSKSVPIPVIACGGAGSVQHVYEAIIHGSADAVCMASTLHYDMIKKSSNRKDTVVDLNTGESGKEKRFSKIQGMALPEIKNHLSQRGIPCRLPESVDSHA